VDAPVSDIPAQIEGERSVSSVTTARRWMTRRQKGALIIVAALSVCALLMFSGSGKKRQQREYVAPLKVGTADRIVAPLDPRPEQAAAFQIPPPLPQPVQQPVQLTQEPRAEVHPPSLFAYKASAPAQAAPASVSGVQPAAAQDGPMAAALKPTVLEGSMATVLPHPEMTIVAGRNIPCTMETAIDSQLPGFATCRIPEDIVGDRDGVVLLDRGTRVFGQVKTEMAQNGAKRVFVLWTRATTPNGVAIALASPATDALGRSGIEGDVDTHWRERFGTALLFSVIEGAASMASSALSGGFSLHGPASAATEVLRGNMNIPPTITVHQGESIGLMVARDLSFENVYNLALTSGRRR